MQAVFGGLNAVEAGTQQLPGESCPERISSPALVMVRKYSLSVSAMSTHPVIRMCPGNVQENAGYDSGQSG